MNGSWTLKATRRRGEREKTNTKAEVCQRRQTIRLPRFSRDLKAARRRESQGPVFDYVKRLLMHSLIHCVFLHDVSSRPPSQSRKFVYSFPHYSHTCQIEKTFIFPHSDSDSNISQNSLSPSPFADLYVQGAYKQVQMVTCQGPVDFHFTIQNRLQDKEGKNK